jgi:hypothetical protein
MQNLIAKAFQHSLIRRTQVFIQEYPNLSAISRFFVSATGIRLFGKSFCNIEHWLMTYPDSSKKGYFARIDGINTQSGNGAVLRGWVFHCTEEITGILLCIDDTSYPVYCKRLLRLDVLDAFEFMPNARHSGFVLHIPLMEQLLTMKSAILQIQTSRQNAIAVNLSVKNFLKN